MRSVEVPLIDLLAALRAVDQAVDVIMTYLKKRLKAFKEQGPSAALIAENVRLKRQVLMFQKHLLAANKRVEEARKSEAGVTPWSQRRAIRAAEALQRIEEIAKALRILGDSVSQPRANRQIAKELSYKLRLALKGAPDSVDLVVGFSTTRDESMG